MATPDSDNGYNPLKFLLALYGLSGFILFILILRLGDEEVYDEYKTRIADPIEAYISDHWFVCNLFRFCLLYFVIGSIIIYLERKD